MVLFLQSSSLHVQNELNFLGTQTDLIASASSSCIELSNSMLQDTAKSPGLGEAGAGKGAREGKVVHAFLGHTQALDQLLILPGW